MDDIQGLSIDELINGLRKEEKNEDDSSLPFEEKCVKKIEMFKNRKDLYEHELFGRSYVYNETFAKVKKIENYGIYLSSDNTHEKFVLNASGDDLQFKEGDHIYMISVVEDGDEYSYLFMLKDEYDNLYGKICEGLSLEKKVKCIEASRVDSEGFQLWKELGKEKKEYSDIERIRMDKLLLERAKMIISRIPVERNDLRDVLFNAMNRLQKGPSNEKADYAEVLNTVEHLIVMMLKDEDNPWGNLDAKKMSDLFPNGKIAERNDIYRTRGKRTPNVLVVGNNIQEFTKTLNDNDYKTVEIQMGGVEGNDFLFGDSMSYYCSGTGELTNKLVKEKTFSRGVIFKHIDLIGTTVRSSNPLYGLKALLQEHRFRDYYIRSLEIDAAKTTFICQVNSVEDCPEILKDVFDIVIELP